MNCLIWMVLATTKMLASNAAAAIAVQPGGGGALGQTVHVSVAVDMTVSMLE